MRISDWSSDVCSSDLFEGDIPKGHYGAGHVDIFDRGVWNAEGDPLQALAAGKIDFELHGEKLQGAWKLVRTAQVRSGKPQWLLLKRDDAWAADLEADDLLDGSGQKSRSDERRVGKECVSPCRSRGSPDY